MESLLRSIDAFQSYVDAVDSARSGQDPRPEDVQHVLTTVISTLFPAKFEALVSGFKNTPHPSGLYLSIRPFLLEFDLNEFGLTDVAQPKAERFLHQVTVIDERLKLRETFQQILKPQLQEYASLKEHKDQLNMRHELLKRRPVPEDIGSLEGLKVQVKELEDRQSRLQNETTQKKNTLEALRRELPQLQLDAQKLSSTNEWAGPLVSSGISDFPRRVGVLGRELDDAITRRDTQQKRNFLATQTSDTLTQVAQLIRECLKNKTQLADARLLYRNVQGELIPLRQHLTRVTADLQVLHTEISQLRKDMAEAETDKKTAEYEIQMLREQQERANHELTERERATKREVVRIEEEASKIEEQAMRRDYENASRREHLNGPVAHLQRVSTQLDDILTATQHQLNEISQA